MMAFVFADIVDLHDVGMSQCRCGLGFAFEAKHGYRIGTELGSQDLDRNLTVENRIHREEYIRHSALPDMLEYFIPVGYQVIAHESHLLQDQ